MIFHIKSDEIFRIFPQASFQFSRASDLNKPEQSSHIKKESMASVIDKKLSKA